MCQGRATNPGPTLSCETPIRRPPLKKKGAPQALALLGAMVILGGCAAKVPPRTAGEEASGYTYVPVDPFPVEAVPGVGCPVDNQETLPPYRPLLESLPDNAVRMLVEQFDASGKVTFGPSELGAKHESYRVTVDYISADTINLPVWIARTMKETGTGDIAYVELTEPPGDDYKPSSEAFEISRDKPAANADQFVKYNIPVYVGVGLRLTANVRVIGADANISGIGIIGAEAEANRLDGSLIVQTLGVNGESVTAALPIQSELNRTTAQNAIVAVGSIKALLYADDTLTYPRVVGLYLPIPGGKPLVNALISELSKQPVPWRRPCLAEAE